MKVVVAFTAALLVCAAASTSELELARVALERAIAAEDASPTKANAEAVDRALEAYNLALEAGAQSKGCCKAQISETEPNDDAATANPLDFGTNPAAVASASITPAADVDYFSFPATDGSKVWACIDSGPSTTGRDSQLNIVDTDGTTNLEFDDDDGAGNSCAGTQQSGLASVVAGLPITAAGTYYARVNEYGDNGEITPYQLYVAVTTGATPEVEPNDSAAMANVLFNGVPNRGVAAGLVDPPGDADFYSVTAGAGDTLFLALNNDPERDGVSNDLDLAIIDTDGTTVLFEADSDSGNPGGEGFCYTVAAPGTYYVRVRDIGGTTIGTYEVMVANTTQNIPVELMSLVVE